MRERLGELLIKWIGGNLPKAISDAFNGGAILAG
jgi:hypothetical protein